MNSNKIREEQRNETCVTLHYTLFALEYHIKKANNVIIPEQNQTSSATTELNVSMYRINIFTLKCPLGICINMSNDARGKLLRKTVVQSISVFS